MHPPFVLSVLAPTAACAGKAGPSAPGAPDVGGRVEIYDNAGPC